MKTLESSGKSHPTNECLDATNGFTFEQLDLYWKILEIEVDGRW